MEREGEKLVVQILFGMCEYLTYSGFFSRQNNFLFMFFLHVRGYIILFVFFFVDIIIGNFLKIQFSQRKNYFKLCIYKTYVILVIKS